MTRIIANTAALRALAIAAATLLPLASAPAQAGALSDCYDYIMSVCPDSNTEYGQCINEGFGLCDNQHPEPLVSGSLDLNVLPAAERRVVRDILRNRGVPARVWLNPDFSGGGDGGRGGASSAPSR